MRAIFIKLQQVGNKGKFRLHMHADDRRLGSTPSQKFPTNFPGLLQVIIRASSVARARLFSQLFLPSKHPFQTTSSTHPVGTPSFFHLPPCHLLHHCHHFNTPNRNLRLLLPEVLRKSSTYHRLPPSIPHATPKLLQAIDTCPFHRMHRIINAWAALTLTGHIAGLLLMIG